MNEKPIIPSRTERAWAVVNGGGYLFMDTIRGRRKDAVIAYGDTAVPTARSTDALARQVYKSDRRKYGVQVVRCTVTTEAQGHA